MATTNIFSIRGSKGRSVICSLTERTDYVKNPEEDRKAARWSTPTAARRSSWRRSSRSRRRLYALRTGRMAPGVIAYHIRQSFKPGEITAEEANRVGRELAERFPEGAYTHT